MKMGLLSLAGISIHVEANAQNFSPWAADFWVGQITAADTVITVEVKLDICHANGDLSKYVLNTEVVDGAIELWEISELLDDRLFNLVVNRAVEAELDLASSTRAFCNSFIGNNRAWLELSG